VPALADEIRDVGRPGAAIGRGPAGVPQLLLEEPLDPVPLLGRQVHQHRCPAGLLFTA
jgi:hypothetical protein